MPLDNFDNLFLIRFDANLSEKGVQEAESGGKALKDAGYTFDIAHTSLLTRAQVTLGKVLAAIDQKDLPIEKTWRLNERHYGGKQKRNNSFNKNIKYIIIFIYFFKALTGLNKAETAAKHGDEQVKIWRRSFDIPPPAMETDHAYYDTIVKDPRYSDGPSADEFPMFESLKLTIERTLPYWNDTIVPQIKEGKKIIIAAHGNSLRGIVKHLDNMSNDEIMGLNLPTGIPFVYKLDENMKPIESMKV